MIVDTISHTLEDQFRHLCRHDPGECAVIYREYYREHANAATHLIPGVEAALEELTQIELPMCVATSKSRPAAEMLLKHLGIRHHFRGVIGPEDVARPKPAPDAIHAAATMLGVETEALAYVGDTTLDIRAAHEAGARCIAVTTGYHSRIELETFEPHAIHADLPAAAGSLAQLFAPANSG